ncbi:MAG: VanZ family protein [Clostridia bacterium]|nr:VanZ family protein [Clostridia bacterium]
MSRIMDYILNMLPYMLISLPIIIVVRVIAVSVFKKKGIKTSQWHEIGLVLFAVFLVGLASQTIIPKIEFGVGGLNIVNHNLESKINLIPGQVFVDTWRECVINGYWNYLIINFIGNICMFVPIGFCIPLLWNGILFWKTTLIGLGTSLFIELYQIPQVRGSDVDDLWLNTLGVVIGYVLFKSFKRLSKELDLKFKVKR